MVRKSVLILLLCASLFGCTAQGITTVLLDITVNETPTTGYKWFYLISDETVLSVTDHGYGAADGGNPMLDLQGTHTWTVSGVREGVASVTFASLRPWEALTTDPVFTYTFEVGADDSLKVLSIERLPEDYTPGKTIIRLIENPSTGYHWEIEENPDGVLKLIVDKYEQDLSSGALAGAGGVHTWVYRGETAGETTLTIRYIGPAGGDAKPAATVRFFFSVNTNLQVAKPGIDGDYAQFNPYMQK